MNKISKVFQVALQKKIRFSWLTALWNESIEGQFFMECFGKGLRFTGMFLNNETLQIPFKKSKNSAFENWIWSKILSQMIDGNPNNSKTIKLWAFESFNTRKNNKKNLILSVFVLNLNLVFMFFPFSNIKTLAILFQGWADVDCGKSIQGVRIIWDNYFVPVGTAEVKFASRSFLLSPSSTFFFFTFYMTFWKIDCFFPRGF